MAYRVSSGPHYVGKLLIHDCHAGRLRVVGAPEDSAPDQRNAHSLKVLRANNVLPCRKMLGAFGRSSLGLYPIARSDVTHWNRESVAQTLDTWNGPYSAVHFLEKEATLFLREPKLPKIHVNVEDTFGSKAKIGT